MAAVEILFPQIYGASLWVVLLDMIVLGAYVALMMMTAREQST